MDTGTMLTEINRLLENLISGAINLIPRLIMAIALFLIGLLIAQLAKMAVRRFILYLDHNFNERLSERFLKVDLHNSANFISKTFYWTIVLFAVAIATQTLDLPILTTWFSGLLLYLPNILAAVIIVFVGIIAGRLTNDLITSTAAKTGISNGAYLGKFVRYTIVFITIVIAVGQIGVDIFFLTNIVTIVVAALLFGAALAFGLGARTSVSNILGSYYVQRTYEEGNTVKIGDIEGVIVKITPTSVMVKTKSGEVTIPAKDFNEVRTMLIKRN